MEQNEKLARLKAMLTQVAPGGNLESIARPPVAPPRPEGTESMLPLEGLFDTGGSFDTGLQKFAEGREYDMSAQEMYTLEAIVMPKERPVVLVRNGSYDDIEAPWQHLNQAETKKRFKPMLRSIGRIEVPGAPWLPYGGTGFIVGTNLVMTNRHVAALVTEGVGTRLQYQSGDAAVNFKREDGLLDTDRSAQFVVRPGVGVKDAMIRFSPSNSRNPAK